MLLSLSSLEFQMKKKTTTTVATQKSTQQNGKSAGVSSSSSRASNPQPVHAAGAVGSSGGSSTASPQALGAGPVTATPTPPPPPLPGTLGSIVFWGIFGAPRGATTSTAEQSGQEAAAGTHTGLGGESHDTHSDATARGGQCFDPAALVLRARCRVVYRGPVMEAEDGIYLGLEQLEPLEEVRAPHHCTDSSCSSTTTSATVKEVKDAKEKERAWSVVKARLAGRGLGNTQGTFAPTPANILRPRRLAGGSSLVVDPSTATSPLPPKADASALGPFVLTTAHTQQGEQQHNAPSSSLLMTGKGGERGIGAGLQYFRVPHASHGFFVRLRDMEPMLAFLALQHAERTAQMLAAAEEVSLPRAQTTSIDTHSKNLNKNAATSTSSAPGKKSSSAGSRLAPLPDISSRTTRPTGKKPASTAGAAATTSQKQNGSGARSASAEPVSNTERALSPAPPVNDPWPLVAPTLLLLDALPSLGEMEKEKEKVGEGAQTSGGAHSGSESAGAALNHQPESHTTSSAAPSPVRAPSRRIRVFRDAVSAAAADDLPVKGSGSAQDRQEEGEGWDGAQGKGRVGSGDFSRPDIETRPVITHSVGTNTDGGEEAVLQLVRPFQSYPSSHPPHTDLSGALIPTEPGSAAPWTPAQAPNAAQMAADVRVAIDFHLAEIEKHLSALSRVHHDSKQSLSEKSSSSSGRLSLPGLLQRLQDCADQHAEALLEAASAMRSTTLKPLHAHSSAIDGDVPNTTDMDPIAHYSTLMHDLRDSNSTSKTDASASDAAVRRAWLQPEALADLHAQCVSQLRRILTAEPFHDSDGAADRAGSGPSETALMRLGLVMSKDNDEEYRSPQSKRVPCRTAPTPSSTDRAVTGIVTHDDQEDDEDKYGDGCDEDEDEDEGCCEGGDGGDDLLAVDVSDAIRQCFAAAGVSKTNRLQGPLAALGPLLCSRLQDMETEQFGPQSSTAAVHNTCNEFSGRAHLEWLLQCHHLQTLDTQHTDANGEGKQESSMSRGSMEAAGPLVASAFLRPLLRLIAGPLARHCGAVDALTGESRYCLDVPVGTFSHDDARWMAYNEDGGNDMQRSKAKSGVVGITSCSGDKKSGCDCPNTFAASLVALYAEHMTSGEAAVVAAARDLPLVIAAAKAEGDSDSGEQATLDRILEARRACDEALAAAAVVRFGPLAAAKRLLLQDEDTADSSTTGTGNDDPHRRLPSTHLVEQPVAAWKTLTQLLLSSSQQASSSTAPESTAAEQPPTTYVAHVLGSHIQSRIATARTIVRDLLQAYDRHMDAFTRANLLLTTKAQTLFDQLTLFGTEASKVVAEIAALHERLQQLLRGRDALTAELQKSVEEKVQLRASHETFIAQNCILRRCADDAQTTLEALQATAVPLVVGWARGVKETEDANLMALQRGLFEMRCQAHTMHAQAYRQAALSTAAAQWSQLCRLQGIDAKIREKNALAEEIAEILHHEAAADDEALEEQRDRHRALQESIRVFREARETLLQGIRELGESQRALGEAYQGESAPLLRSCRREGTAFAPLVCEAALATTEATAPDDQQGAGSQREASLITPRREAARWIRQRAQRFGVDLDDSIMAQL